MFNSSTGQKRLSCSSLQLKGCEKGLPKKTPLGTYLRIIALYVGVGSKKKYLVHEVVEYLLVFEKEIQIGKELRNESRNELDHQNLVP